MRVTRHARRRGGSGAGRRGGFRGFGRGGPAVLSLSSGGTFTRSTEGSYLTGSPTDGSSAFLAWAAANARRVGMLGLLLEGSRTNSLGTPRAPSTANGWLSVGAVTETAAYGPSPDGSTSYRIQCTSAQGRYRLCAVSGTYASSWWMRPTASGDNIVGQTSAPVILCVGETPTTTALWRRYFGSSAPVGALNFYAQEGRDNGGGFAAGARDALVDLMQVEAGAFSTSPIQTASTRGADVLSYATGGYAASILSTGFRVVVLPGMTSAELIAANIDMRVVQVGANDYLRIRVNAGAVNIDLVCGGVIKGTLAVTFTSRDQPLTITVQPTLGTLTVSGATTGDGTNTVAGAAWAAASTLYVGADDAGTNPLFAHIRDARLVLL